MRVLERRQDVALARKATGQILAIAAEPRQLQGDLPLDGTVRALRQPHLGHAAFAEQPDQSIRPHQVAGEPVTRKCRGHSDPAASALSDWMQLSFTARPLRIRAPACYKRPVQSLSA